MCSISNITQFSVVTPATTWPVSVAEAKVQSRITFNDEDSLFQALIQAATEFAQTYTGIQFMPAVFKGILPGFTSTIRLHRSPVQAITWVKYYDSDNTLQTLSTDDYNYELITKPCQLNITNIPSTYDRPDAVQIQFTAGYAAYGNSTQGTGVDLSANTISLVDHGLQDNQLLWFTSLGTVTGPYTYTPYFITNATDDTFQVTAALVGGSAIDLAGLATTPPIWQTISSTGALPEQLKAAIKLIIAHWYEHREEVGMSQFHNLPIGAETLLNLNKTPYVA